MRWISGQFTTRVIVLMPVAIAINIVLGYTIQSVLKLPIYMDSIGTIFVGVLAGPLAGALTGDPLEPDLAVRAGHRRRHDRPICDHGRRHRPARRPVGLPGRLPFATSNRDSADARGDRRRRSS